MEALIFGIMVGIAIIVGIKIVPPLVFLSKFSYSNAKFSAIPITFLKEKEIMRLLEMENIEELKNNVYSRDFVLKGENVAEIQRNIDKSLFRLLEMAKNDSPKNVSNLYDAYMKKIDCHALKEAILAIKDGREIENKAFTPEFKKLIDKLKTNPEIAEEILRENGWDINMEKSVEEIERDFEVMAIKYLQQVKLPKLHKKLVNKFVKSMVDILNIKAILRGKYYNMPVYLYGGGWEVPEWKLNELVKVDHVMEIVSLLEGTSYFNALKNAVADFEREGVVAFERALDGEILRIAREIANDNPLGIGPGIRFIVEKEMEARNLKIVVKSVAEGKKEIGKKLVVVE